MSGDGLGSDDVDVSLDAPIARDLQELGFPRFQISVRERRKVRHPKSVKGLSHSISRIYCHGDTSSETCRNPQTDPLTARLLVMRFVGSTRYSPRVRQCSRMSPWARPLVVES